MKKFTLITGASMGIGKALAAECASRGMNLFLVSLPGDGLESFRRELEKKYYIVTEYLCIDLSKESSASAVYEYARSHHLQVDTLINNAGTGHAGDFHQMDPAEIREMIDLNLRALTTLSLLFIRDMIRNNRGHIVNVGSLGAYTPVAYKSVYLATKSYVFFFTSALNEEYKNTPLKFSVLMPGGVATNDMVKERVKDAGLLSKISVLTPEYVARYTLDKMGKGKFTIMPGVASRSIFSVSKILPTGVLLHIMKKVFGNHK